MDVIAYFGGAYRKGKFVGFDGGFVWGIVPYQSPKRKTAEPARIWRGDLLQSRNFTHKTVRAMAKLLGPLTSEELEATLSERFKEPP